ncbi:hypothetical protein SISSUDRAFT_1052736 [Sistotremastrum suecicum HHB10207 ss-3]|uniref:Cell wall protein n=1 Tax=Sistotremastrum suecicum HHB10207 ss-3 TaxID=1314776 RepID=A0A165ZNV0_9AGAM|nr:hypothetical protein SISSUDRAFT_1052736 [Sistotremastrum suecicum HHB10207 ss-3]
MHFSLSTSTFVLALLFSSALAAPASLVQERGIIDDIKNAAHNLENATVSGVVNTLKQSIENPALTEARLEVIKGISQTTSALTAITAQANSTDNLAVASISKQAQQGVNNAQQGIDNIGQALISGNTPSKTDQKNVAQGIKTVQDGVACMPSAITKPDETLNQKIAAGQTALGLLRAGGEGVLSASNLSFGDLGLPDDFDSEQPDCSSFSSSGDDTSST